MLARQTGRWTPPKEVLRGNLAPAQTRATHGSTGRLIPGGSLQHRSNHESRGIDLELINRLKRASILRDFAGLESPERPNQNQAVFLE